MAACNVCVWRLRNVPSYVNRPAAVVSYAWSNANPPAGGSTPISVILAVADWPHASVASTVSVIGPDSTCSKAKKLPAASSMSTGWPLTVTASIGTSGEPGVARPVNTV
jgi:hypothetical protein